MKCSQCGCNDLVEVDFPHEVNIIQTGVGLNGYSSSYDIEDDVYCDSYVCVNCGHFEFFNLNLAEQIKEDRLFKEKTKKDIEKIEKEIDELNNKISSLDLSIKELKKESLNLDITVRRSNEIQDAILSKKEEIKKTNKIVNEKNKELGKLKKMIK